jgi:hypothetical protein
MRIRVKMMQRKKLENDVKENCEKYGSTYSRDALLSLVWILIEQNPANLFCKYQYLFAVVLFFANFSFPFDSRPCEKPWWI